MAHNHSHDHHGHSHSLPADAYLNKAFIIGIGLNLVFVAVEFIAGFILDSVSLISDAGHNLSDVVSLALSLIAFRLAKLKPTSSYTYGHKKTTILASLVNACLLVFAVIFIVYESVEKLQNPQPLEGGAIAWVAGVGIVINAFTAWLFMRHRDKDLNIKGAYLHMAADALVSVGVVISGLVIKYTGAYIIDPIIGIAIAVVILVSTWGLMRDSVRLILDGVPSGIDTRKTAEGITALDSRIVEVHHIHIWALSTTENALTAHIVVNSADNLEELKHEIKHYLCHHQIAHSTLEFELAGSGHECRSCS